MGVNDPLMRVGGIASLAMSIRRMQDVELTKEMKAASKAAAEKVVPVAQTMAPVRTGALRQSIRATSTRRHGIINAGYPSRVKYAYNIHRGFTTADGFRYIGKKYISNAVPEAWPQIVKEYTASMNSIAKRFEKKHGVARVYGGFK